MELIAVRLNILLVCLITLFIYGCGFLFGDSYEEDKNNDWKIVREIITANPVLRSAN